MSSARLSYRERREQAAQYRPIDPREKMARHRDALAGLEQELAIADDFARETLAKWVARYRDAIEVQEDNER